VPQRSVISRDGDKFVLVGSEKNIPEEKKIEVGLRGSDGNIEIISGLVEGEKIVNSPSL